MSNKKEEKKSINDMIIEEAVKQFKKGKIQNSLDVDGYKEILGMWIDKSESSSFLEQRI